MCLLQSPVPRCQGQIYLDITLNAKAEVPLQGTGTNFTVKDYLKGFEDAQRSDTLCTFLANKTVCQPLFEGLPWITAPSSVNISACAAEGRKGDATVESECPNPWDEPSAAPSEFPITWNLTAPKISGVCPCVEDLDPVINQTTIDMEQDLQKYFEQKYAVVVEAFAADPATCNNVSNALCCIHNPAYR